LAPLRGEIGITEFKMSHGSEFFFFNEKNPAIVGVNVNGASQAARPLAQFAADGWKASFKTPGKWCTVDSHIALVWIGLQALGVNAGKLRLAESLWPKVTWD
jgi:hypothetical protein